MPNPKDKTSKARKRKRRAHHALAAPGFAVCPNCKHLKLPHRICGSCGHYGKRPIVELEEEE
ncbi:MAG: 50S ribosomal protein L32 [Planctomycetes bacterium]|nr:50S ribosomal protein L32 [Planctomycetota bacterium]